jgi:uncharacterized protein (DUF433 family)
MIEVLRGTSQGGRLGSFASEAYCLLMESLKRISIEPTIRFGKPCVRGTRITVGEVLGYLGGGGTEAELFADFPQLTHEDVLACLGSRLNASDACWCSRPRSACPPAVDRWRARGQKVGRR